MSRATVSGRDAEAGAPGLGECGVCPETADAEPRATALLRSSHLLPTSRALRPQAPKTQPATELGDAPANDQGSTLPTATLRRLL